MPENAASAFIGDGTDDVDGLSVAYAELQNLLLEHVEVTTFLQRVADLAPPVVPAASASITMRKKYEFLTVASSGEFASRIDEIQYGGGQGPCLESLRTGNRVEVPDLTTEDRWPAYRPHALEEGVRSSLSLPLTVDGSSIGALNLYATATKHFDARAVRRANGFARQAATALTIVTRQGEQLTLQQQLREALATRAVIDQAIGMIAGQQRCDARQAFDQLRQASQRRNLKLSLVAAQMIEAISGHPYQPPPPFAQPR